MNELQFDKMAVDTNLAQVLTFTKLQQITSYLYYKRDSL